MAHKLNILIIRVFSEEVCWALLDIFTLYIIKIYITFACDHDPHVHCLVQCWPLTLFPVIPLVRSPAFLSLPISHQVVSSIQVYKAESPLFIFKGDSWTQIHSAASWVAVPASRKSDTDHSLTEMCELWMRSKIFHVTTWKEWWEIGKGTSLICLIHLIVQHGINTNFYWDFFFHSLFSSLVCGCVPMLAWVHMWGCMRKLACVWMCVEAKTELPPPSTVLC